MNNITENEVNEAENKVRLLQCIIDNYKREIKGMKEEIKSIKEEINELNKIIISYYRNQYITESIQNI